MISYNITITDVYILSPAVFVEQEEASCPGIRQCYAIANAKSTRAYRLKDLSAICLSVVNLVHLQRGPSVTHECTLF